MPDSTDPNHAPDRSERVCRRSVLAAVGTATVGGLAGCSGSDGGDAGGAESGETSADGGGSGGPDTGDLQFHHPDSVRFDEPFSLEISDIPHETVTVSAWLHDYQTTWKGSAVYDVEDGHIALDETAPRDAPFGAGTMNLLQWAQPRLQGGTYFPEVERGDDVTIQVEYGTETLGATSVERTVADGATEREVDDENVVGLVYEPPGDDPVPALVTLHGSEGVPAGADAALLAAQGYLVLALQYFEWGDDYDRIPNKLVEVPLEYVEGAVDWVLDHERSSGEQVGLWGKSKGGELALLAGSRLDTVGPVVSIAGSGFVWAGVGYGRELVPGPSWTEDGEPIPYIPYAAEDLWEQDPPRELEPAYSASFEAADEDTRMAAAIPVEEIDGPVLLVSGDDDRLWNAVELQAPAADRLEGHAYEYDHLVYEDAGHAISIPYRPAKGRSEGRTYVYGGTTAGYAEADVDHWPRVLETFETVRRD